MASSSRPSSAQALPTAHNTFPTPYDADSSAPSVISSRVTSGASEEGQHGQSRLEKRGPPGEPGLPPSRPRTAKSTPRTAGGSLRMGGVSQKRPVAATRTHVPTLTAHAFFKPMNSQQLQAQRAQRSSQVYGQSGLSQEAYNDVETNSNTNTQSVRSLPLGRASMALQHDEEMPPPPTRDTMTTERHTGRYAETLDIEPQGMIAGLTTPSGLRSRGESVTRLQQVPSNDEPMRTESEKPPQAASPIPPPLKSPRSFRSSFIRQSRNSAQMRPQGHEKLSSAESSPRFAPPDMAKEEVKEHLGRNYQYFTGNTVFCWGGRLQNARDRPINIATGLLIVIPTALFCGFS